MAGISDRRLREIAKAIGNNTKLMDLGIELGIKFQEIRNYRASNHSGGEVSAEGTTSMLFSWREGITPAQQRNKLREALEKVELVGIAEEYLSEDGSMETDIAQPVAQQVAQPVAAVQPQRAAPAESDDTLTHDQLEALSKKFPRGKYYGLCDKLGRDYNDAEGVLTQYFNDSKRALLNVFNEWKDRTGGTRQKMDAALRKAGAGGLVGTY